MYTCARRALYGELPWSDGILRSGGGRSETNMDSSEKSVSTALFSGGSAGCESANRLTCGDTVIREPSAESREPRAESREPRAESREPRAESREPRAESREPRAESREPRAESREPRAESREPRAESREPRAESREPRAESREPRAESREPRAESREPRAESREPRAESREPRAESREPRAEVILMSAGARHASAEPNPGQAGRLAPFVPRPSGRSPTPFRQTRPPPRLHRDGASLAASTVSRSRGRAGRFLSACIRRAAAALLPGRAAIRDATPAGSRAFPATAGCEPRSGRPVPARGARCLPARWRLSSSGSRRCLPPPRPRTRSTRRSGRPR